MLYENAQTEHLENIMKAAAEAHTPLHRAILENYATHVALEQGGRYPEILTDEMMVEVPHYTFRFYQDQPSMVANTREEVGQIYSGIENSLNAVLIDNKIAVADWGFVDRANQLTFGQGKQFIAQGVELDDPQAWYIEALPVVLIWGYTSEAKLTGEEIYTTAPGTYTKADPADLPPKELYQKQCNDFLESIGKGKAAVDA